LKFLVLRGQFNVKKWAFQRAYPKNGLFKKGLPEKWAGRKGPKLTLKLWIMKAAGLSVQNT